ncbi:ribbon-helix-helix domain-containing protein (plasmid) [Bacteroides fragilis]|nr:ribbon-helix-helix domain-containing protein [Bacteroides fragilis]
MDKETTTSVTIDRKTFARLDRLAKSNNVSKKDFLSCALEYFEKYGINPVEHESPAKEMQKLIKRCDHRSRISCVRLVKPWAVQA